MATVTKSVQIQGKIFTVEFENSGWAIGIVRVLDGVNKCVLTGYVNDKNKLKWNTKEDVLVYDFVKKLKAEIRKLKFIRDEKIKLQNKKNKG